MKYISESALIREMDAEEIVEYYQSIKYTEQCDKYYELLSDQYHQLTGKTLN